MTNNISWILATHDQYYLELKISMTNNISGIQDLNDRPIIFLEFKISMTNNISGIQDLNDQ